MSENVRNPFNFTPVRYEFPLPKIRAQGTIASIGSCFSQDLVRVLLSSSMKGAQNPNGVLYNPVSICDAMMRLTCGYEPGDFFEYNGLYHSWAHHGSFSAATPEEGAERANKAAKEFLRTVKKADVFLMTVSSCIVYLHKPERRVVANCHKVPGNEFERMMLSFETCRAAILTACRRVREFNPDCPIILTLSPVRHDPGNLPMNAQSKAQLLTAIHQVCDVLPQCAYFPAWEILNDELRDYRFYAEDMLHPSEAAKKIILERFLDACFIPRAKADYLAAEQQRRQTAHIPIHEG